MPGQSDSCDALRLVIRDQGREPARRVRRLVVSQFAFITAWMLLLRAHPVAAARPSRAELIRFVDSLAQASLQSGPIAGMSIAVVRGSDLVVAKGYGFADLENRVRATEHTVYRIGSITKQFTAGAILQLAERGQLRLDDEITRYLPGYDTHGYRITIRQLLNHTSGIRGFTEVSAFQGRDRLDLSPDSMLALFQHEPLDFVPGTGYVYSNSAYYLLARIIQRVSGQSYGNYLREHVFMPLGLNETYSCDDAPIISHRARGYTFGEGELQNAPYLSMLPPTGGGSICSTVLDLVTWTRALAEGRFISHASYAQMTTPLSLPDGRILGYGYGLAISTLAGHLEIAHAGTISGFSGYSAFYPRDSITVVVLCNTLGPVFPGLLARAIARRALSVPVESPKRIPLSPDERARVVGTYGAGRLQIAVSDVRDTLKVNDLFFDEVYLYQGHDVFASARNPEIRAVFSGRGRHADRLVLDMAGLRVYDVVRAP